MQKKYLVINILIFYVALFALGCANPRILIKGKDQTALDGFKFADIRCHSDDWAIMQDRYENKGLGDSYLWGKIRASLNEVGISWTADETKADLGVECHYRTGWCLPYTGRHFDVFFKSYHTVCIKFIDKSAKRVVCEMEYRRPRLTTKPPEDFMDDMFSKLLGKRIVSRSPDGVPVNLPGYGAN